MKSATTVIGKSGTAYSFADIDHAALLPRTAGNFIYVREEDERRIVLYIGACDDLLEQAQERWSEAVSAHGATHLDVRRIICASVRDQELADILLAIRPVMNADRTVAAERAEQPEMAESGFA